MYCVCLDSKKSKGSYRQATSDAVETADDRQPAAVTTGYLATPHCRLEFKHVAAYC